jgi:hypothetical protein
MFPPYKLNDRFRLVEMDIQTINGSIDWPPFNSTPSGINQKNGNIYLRDWQVLLQTPVET